MVYMIIMYILGGCNLICGFVNQERQIWSCFDHTSWNENAKPSLKARISDVKD